MKMKNICKTIVLFILLVNTVYAQYGNNTGNTKTEPNSSPVIFYQVNNVVDGTNDGIVGLDIQNPSNDTMNVEIEVIPPPDIFIYGGEGFTERNGIMGAFIIDPGKSRKSFIIIKSDKVGGYSLVFNGQYWYDNSFKKSSIKTYTQIINVKTPSKNPRESNPSNTVSIPEPSPTKPAPGLSIGFSFFVIMLIYLYMKINYKKQFYEKIRKKL